MKLISFDDINKLRIPILTCYKWVEHMIENKKSTLLPPKISIKPYDGVFCNVMPAMVQQDDQLIGGVKMVTRYPNKIPSIEGEILLFNANSGERLALMDCTWITAMRTGAVAAHSVKTFAKKDFSTIGIIGAGNVSCSTLIFLAEMYKERLLTIKILKHKGQEFEFAKRFAEYENIKFKYVETAYEVIKGSDVVISGVTYAPADFCNDDAFDEGVLVIPIHTLGFTNCDLFFDKVFADDYGHVCNFKNFGEFLKFGEVSDVTNGLICGRENDRERILVYNIGISVHDVNFAWHIYSLLEKNEDIFSSLLSFTMSEPKEKLWL